jgi:spore coat-associated protein N
MPTGSNVIVRCIRRPRLRTAGALLLTAGLMAAGSTISAAAGLLPHQARRSTAASGRAALELRPTASGRAFDTVSAMAPGDRAERQLDLANTGRTAVGRMTLTITAVQRSPLDSDRASGLQITIDRCSLRWVVTATRNRCAGTRTVILAARPLIGKSVSLNGLGTLRGGQVAHLRFTLTLPFTATAQAELSRVDYFVSGSAT